MNQIVDLTMPIENHFRWHVDRQLKEDFKAGSAFQVTWVGWAVHGFTHIDAPRHIDPNGGTTSDISLNQVVGRAAIVDLTGIEPNSAITEVQVRDAGDHINPGRYRPAEDLLGRGYLAKDPGILDDCAVHDSTGVRVASIASG